MDQYAEINGSRLRYRVAGEGPLAVFGHGLLGSIEQIGENVAGIDALYDRVRLLTYDARGHGKSGGPEKATGYTWESLGQDMLAFADHHGAEQAVFGGASMGAATSLWIGIERPERVRALVLVMPPPLGHDAMRRDDEKQAIQVLDLLSAAVTNFGLEQTVAMARNFPGFAATPEEAETRANWLLAQNPLALTQAIRGLLQSPFHDPSAYAEIKAPALVIAHEGDGLHPVRAAQLLADSIPDCRLAVASDPNYWRQNPAAFLAEVNAFLDRVL